MEETNNEWIRPSPVRPKMLSLSVIRLDVTLPNPNSAKWVEISCHCHRLNIKLINQLIFQMLQAALTPFGLSAGIMSKAPRGLSIPTQSTLMKCTAIFLWSTEIHADLVQTIDVVDSVALVHGHRHLSGSRNHDGRSQKVLTIAMSESFEAMSGLRFLPMGLPRAGTGAVAMPTKHSEQPIPSRKS
ncbi:hypothetical protein ACLOJK_030032 [Asimina triloba]